MPSGYTEMIGKGCTFPEFALTCARAMGACITMRDDPLDAPIPDEFLPNLYDTKRLADARARLDALSKMTKPEIAAACEHNNAVAYEEFKRGSLARAALLSQYQAMLLQVNEWRPPTPDHEGLKAFMIEQIRESIKFDCSGLPSPQKLTPEVWFDREVDRAKRDITHYTASNIEEIKRARQRTVWIQNLKASLGIAANGVQNQC